MSSREFADWYFSEERTGPLFTGHRVNVPDTDESVVPFREGDAVLIEHEGKRWRIVETYGDGWRDLVKLIRVLP